jgi:hypothetical protein
VKSLIKELGRRVKLGQSTWQEAANEFNQQMGAALTKEAIRKRYANLKDDTIFDNTDTNREYETLYGDGTVEAQKIVNLSREEKASPDIVLKKIGYNPEEWELVLMSFSNWQQHTKEQTTKELYAVKFRIKPKLKEYTTTDYLKVAKEVFREKIKPLKITPKKEDKELNNDKLMEFPAIELHLGKLSWGGDTGQDYDQHIAKARFYKIIEEVVNEQNINKCGTCFLTIGNDFFNSDTTTNTTTKGTPQNNDIRWKKMFLIGLKLYTEALMTLREKFNNIDVQLCQGNHDAMASFYLYIALQQYFRNDNIIKFSDNLKTVQCYSFGKCAIFTSHGDGNLKRLVKSIPAEFYEEWGKSIHRELHLGHLHKEVVVDDESGMITRRIGSPSGTDEWHYSERYIGTTQKHQLFIWHKEHGLLNCRYITFEEKGKKKLLKR